MIVVSTADNCRLTERVIEIPAGRQGREMRDR